MAQLMRQAQLATLLDVNPKTVHMWAKRRASTGFPHPVDRARWGRGWVGLWDPNEVLAWHQTYVPNKGGHPFASPHP